MRTGRLWPYLKTGRQKTQSFGCIKARTQIGHRRWCSWFLLCLVALGATAEVAAQRPGDQLEVEVFDPFTPFDQVDLAGFRPITVTVKPIAGTIGQRDVPIWIVQRLRERFSYSSSREVVRYHRFVLPAGASSITAQFVALCRHDSYWNESLHLELDGDLRFRTGDKADFAQAEPFGNRVRTGHLPRILWLTSDRQMLDTDRVRNLLIDFSKRRGDGQFQVDLGRSQPYPQAAELGQLAELESVLVEAYGREFFSENGKKLAPVGGTAPHFDWTFFSACPPSYFPEEWTPLTNVDLVLCQRNELEALNPAQLRTLADWVGLGGRLVVTGCRENSSDQASLPEFLLGAELAAGQQLRQPQWWQAKPLQENGFPQASVENAPEYLGNSSYDYPGIYFSTVRFAPVKLDVAPRSVEEEAVTYFDYLFGRVLCLGPGVTELGAQGWRALLMASYGNGRG